MKNVLKHIAAAALIIINIISVIPAYAKDFNIDYDKAFRKRNLFAYLENILSDADAESLSSGDLSDIADYIEYAAGIASITEVMAADNSVDIDGEVVKNKDAAYTNEIQKYTALLSEYGITLNRELNTNLYVIIKGMDLSSYANITITKSNLEKLRDIGTTRFIIEGKNEYISLSKDTINKIYNDYGIFSIQLQEHSGTYSVRFLDGEGRMVNKYAADVGIGIPANTPNSTVYIFFNNHQENWGGQYDDAEKLIEFTTGYSGEYSVSEPDIAINDIDGLSDYEKDVIKFMTVRQYLEPENGLFHPTSTLSRYQFTQALVRMMFAIDDEAVCTFSDVDSENYRYIASSEQKSIVKGYDDGTFRGNEAITGEQVIALASRTISEKNGYLYPDKIDTYLSFAGGNIAEWAEKEVALAVREGIYDPGTGLNLKEPIDRKNAAMILYRLFMIMNNTPPMSVSQGSADEAVYTHKSFWTAGNAMAAVLIPAFIDMALIAALVVFLRKKKHQKAD